MAAFAIFSNSQEKITASYGEFIERLHREAKLQLGDKPLILSATTYKYYCTQKLKHRQHVFKDYIYHLRMKMFDGGPGLMICENPTPTFKFFIHRIERLKLLDNKLNAYYGDLKQTITGFMNYFTSLIDETGKKINKYSYSINNKLFMELIDKTIDLYEENHEQFLNQYQPLTSEIEKERYQQVVDGQTKFLTEMREMRDAWEFRLDKLEEFVKAALDKSLRKISDLCNFTHSYISLMLADRLYEIAVSLEESADRLRTNLRKYKEERAEKKNMLINKLYEKNKERLDIQRRLYNRSTDTAEVNKTMDLLKQKINNSGNEETLARLEVETGYWDKRLKDFNEISSMLVRIQDELATLEADRKKYKSITCLELPGSKTACFELMGENIDERISYFHQKELETSKALVTFFCVRGTDRVLYTDRAGSFYVDEFNHQNYITNYGLKYFHVNCYGEFIKKPLDTPYYFDDCGRYTLDENGEKIYQVAPCTSQYNLCEDGLLRKITKDCGHSERPNPDCRLEEIKDLTDKEILPNIEPMDITGTLDSESVKFLWESVGMILSDVLYEVATKQPKNPIHAMARLLIKRKFEASAKELRDFKKNAEKYRNDIKKKLEDKAIEEKRAWQAKQVPRAKPQDCDDSYERAAYQQTVDWLFVDTMGYYD